ncbi:LysR family transcriptional regulator [Kiloniella majae]|uniref:LysR family transcriptional regulator n=1 Tax=Kiloniella majae TaxID=1938558 RepID=UPI000A27810E|nr:LysR family transcriptional regulator [Kiloniella majae]
MINLNDMVLFAKVAELEGISAAARVLNIPKSRVSRRIATLENDLGVRLIERTTRAVQLTEMGAIFFHHCRRIVEESESAVETIHNMRETPRGNLRVSVSFAIGQYLVAPYLGEFSKLYPDIKISLDLNNRHVDLITEGYDLVVRVGEQKDSSLMSKLIGQARAKLCASPAYLEEHGHPTSLEQLPDHKILMMSDSNALKQWVLENQSGKLCTVDVVPNDNINDFTALRSMIEDGCGISIIPEYVIQNSIDTGKLVNVLPDWQSKVISYYVLYPSRKGLTKKARAWIDFFEEKFKANTKS